MIDTSKLCACPSGGGIVQTHQIDCTEYALGIIDLCKCKPSNVQRMYMKSISN